MSRPDGALLVLGIGNVLLRDEGIGVRVVDEIGRLADRGDVALPPGTELMDGGTRGLALLSAVADARALLVVDAARLGRAPGSVTVVRGDALRAAPDGDAAARPGGLARLLGVARAIGALPGAVALVGIEPAEIGVGLDLTDAVRAAMPIAVTAALGEIERLHASTSPVDPGRPVRPSTPSHRIEQVMA
jgi:hydrogenase maturation protease